MGIFDINEEKKPEKVINTKIIEISDNDNSKAMK